MEHVRHSLIFIPIFVYEDKQFSSLKFKDISYTHSFIPSTPA